MPFKSLSAFVAIAALTSSAAGARTVDPLIALSVLSGAQSQTAVCASGSCSGGSLAAASSGSAVATEAGAAQDTQMEGTSGQAVSGSMVPLWIALGTVFAGWSWILLDDDDDGDVNLPISP